jgi:hypothetical protein
MTKEQFVRYSYRHSERIEFIWPSHPEIIVLCMLLAVDFEEELFQLEPFGTDKELYTEKTFWARREYCRKPIKPLKIVKT